MDVGSDAIIEVISRIPAAQAELTDVERQTIVGQHSKLVEADLQEKLRAFLAERPTIVTPNSPAADGTALRHSGPS